MMYYNLFLTKMSVPRCVLPSGWLVLWNTKPGMFKLYLFGRCVSEIRIMSMSSFLKKCVISDLCWFIPFAFQKQIFRKQEDLQHLVLWPQQFLHCVLHRSLYSVRRGLFRRQMFAKENQFFVFFIKSWKIWTALCIACSIVQNLKFLT